MFYAGSGHPDVNNRAAAECSATDQRLSRVGVRQILYRSAAARPFTDRDLEFLQENAERNNARRAITGFLLYCRGAIVQLIEGGEHEIGALYAKIEQDRRHRNVTLLFDESTERRLVPTWTMGVLDLGSAVDSGTVNPDAFLPLMETCLVCPTLTEGPLQDTLRAQVRFALGA